LSARVIRLALWRRIRITAGLLKLIDRVGLLAEFGNGRA
jgi:hypothetical protein